jgi:predicted RNA-binding protein with EMAP domain
MVDFMNNIITIVAFTLAGSFAFAYLFSLIKINKINKSFTKLMISYKSLQEFIDSNNVQFKNENDIHKENFIKFLSDSRDWSFSYIEDVQNKINKMIADLRDDVEYFEKFESLYDGHPSYDILKNFVKSYKELEDLLPKENYK